MKLLLIGIILLFAFCNSVNALPPTVDFNFTPSNPVINQSILFTPIITSTLDLNNLNWQFDTDGNVNYFRTFDPTFNLFVDNFTVSNGTDLNSYNPDWNSFADTTKWSNEIWNNRMKFDVNNDGVGGTGTLNLLNKDVNILTQGKIYQVYFTFYDLNHLAGDTHTAEFFLLRPSDNNRLVNFNVTRATSGGAMSLSGGIANVATFSGQTISSNDSLRIVLTRKTNNFIYDINFLKNGTSLLQLLDQNINSDSFRYQQRLVVGGPGTGRASLLIDDFNITSNDINGNFIPPSPINYNQTQTRSFSSGGNKTICLTAGNTDGNSTLCKNLFVNTFVQLKILDENNQTPINNASISYDSNSVLTNSNGDANITIDNLVFPLTLTVSATNYDTRTFTYLSESALIEDNFLNLRYAPTTQNISFQFFAPDKVTKLSNRIISVTKGLGLSGRGLTDESGILTLNLAPQDNSYNFLVYSSSSDANSSFIDYNYSTITVTVNSPRDEANNSIISGGFNIDVGGLGSQNYVNQSVFPLSTIYIIGNTTDAYTLRIVDNNSNGQQYFSRNYILNDKGNATSVVINPYLISINDGILVNLKVADLSTNQTVPNIRIQMKIGIGGTLTTVEDQITDSAGIAQVVMLSQKTYSLYITSINQDVNYFTGPQLLTPSNQNFTIWINYSSNQITINQDNTLITIFPTTTAIVNNPQRIDVNVDTTAPHDFIYVQAYDSNTLVDQNNCSSSPCHVALTLNFNNFDTNFLNIKVIIQNQDFNFTRTISYYTAPFLNSIVTRVQNLKNEIGPVTLGVIMFAVIFGLIAFLGSNGLGNNMSQIFLIVITAGVFYFLWFYDVTKLFGGELFVAFLAGLFGVMLIYFWARQKGGP